MHNRRSIRLKEFDYTYSDGFVPSERDAAGTKPAAQARIVFYYGVYVEARESVWGGGGWGGAIECEGAYCEGML